MSKCIYKEIANNLDKTEFENYYMSHTVEDTCNHFDFHSRYLYRILYYLDIEVGCKERYSFINKNVVCTEERNKKVSASNKYRIVNDETRKKLSATQKGRSRNYDNPSFQSYMFKKGRTPWNKGSKGLQTWSEEQRRKYYKTMDNKGWFKNSGPEEELLSALVHKYGKDDIIHPYREERYPFNCDFYVKSLDLFIELNYWWHHGPHKFDPSDKEDLELLSSCQSRSTGNDQYAEFIRTWTVRDINKFNIAETNNLNYLAIYPENYYNFITSLAI